MAITTAPNGIIGRSPNAHRVFLGSFGFSLADITFSIGSRVIGSKSLAAQWRGVREFDS
jgi:hypothetical protein